jgi:hypothetical protein
MHDVLATILGPFAELPSSTVEQTNGLTSKQRGSPFSLSSQIYHEPFLLGLEVLLEQLGPS